ncbi:hypothetical protein A4A49_27739 [Nicotiana attenuata]|uniref:Peptidase A1 domain-containing protein n=1 Tax=Nicotiana attenuata TaxID=49451 RepID=A0A314KLH7_NICAT|nr:hypothetical protein A4A49_27739 [Nicotiana attenuata]
MSLNLNSQVFGGKHEAILDSGTTYAYLPEAAFVAFKNVIMKELHSLKHIEGPNPSFKDICFSGIGSDISQLSKNLPHIDMVFDDGKKLTLSPENYLFQAICVFHFQYDSSRSSTYMENSMLCVHFCILMQIVSHCHLLAYCCMKHMFSLLLYKCCYLG